MTDGMTVCSSNCLSVFLAVCACVFVGAPSFSAAVRPSDDDDDDTVQSISGETDAAPETRRPYL